MILREYDIQRLQTQKSFLQAKKIIKTKEDVLQALIDWRLKSIQLKLSYLVVQPQNICKSLYA